MILLEFFFFLTRALKTPWWTGLVLCALFRACSDYFFHTSTPSPFCFIIPHSPAGGNKKDTQQWRVSWGLWVILGDFSPPRTCAILSMSTSGSELPKARLDSPGTGQTLRVSPLASSRTPPRSSPRPPPRSGPGCAASVSAPPLSCRWPPRGSAPRPRGWPKAPAPRLPGPGPR